MLPSIAEASDISSRSEVSFTLTNVSTPDGAAARSDVMSGARDDRQRTTPLPSRTAKSHHQPKLGVDDLDVARAGLGGLASAHGEIVASHSIGLPRN